MDQQLLVQQVPQRIFVGQEHGFVQIPAARLPQFLHAGKVPSRFCHVGEKNNLGQVRHPGAARRVPADRFQDVGVRDAVFFPGKPGAQYGMQQDGLGTFNGSRGQTQGTGPGGAFRRRHFAAAIVQQGGDRYLVPVRGIKGRQLQRRVVDGAGMAESFRFQ